MFNWMLLFLTISLTIYSHKNCRLSVKKIVYGSNMGQNNRFKLYDNLFKKER